MLGNRNAQHSFAKVPEINIPRSSMDRSSTVKDTFNFDYLVPIFVDEVLPGDTMNLNLHAFARLATQKVPIMDNMYVDYFFFFVPNRLTWQNWERFNGAQDDPDDSTDFVVPYVNLNGVGVAEGTIYDKMGLPLLSSATPTPYINSLPFRAYNLIWNEWFRDQNLQNSVIKNIDDGPDASTDFKLLKRGKRHDYFTSCLPWPQKGPDVTIPLTTNQQAPVYGPPINGITATLSRALWQGINNVPATVTDFIRVNSSGSSNTLHSSGLANTVQGIQMATKAQYAAFNGSDSKAVPPFADLSDLVGPTINAFREAYLMQTTFEIDARGGTRYVEILRNHFGVISPDFRLQRPEYLGGGQAVINSHPVAQTVPTQDSPQANLASFGVMSTRGSNIGFTKSFVEHGYVIGLACARADITYQQNLNRMWTRRTRFDFFWPSLQGLGEQAVLNHELFITGTPTDSDVFGYQERYAEYKYKPSEIHGKFRSTYAQSLDFWHLAQEFDSQPVLNAEFIEQETPIERSIAVTSEPHLLFDGFFKLHHARAMKMYATPASLGRF